MDTEKAPMKDEKSTVEDKTSQYTSGPSTGEAISMTTAIMDSIHNFVMETEEKLIKDKKNASEDGTPYYTPGPLSQEIDDQSMSITSSTMDGIQSAMMESNENLSLFFNDDDQDGLSIIGDGALLDGEVQQLYSPQLLHCIHVGSWANVYRFDDPTNTCGGNTGAIIMKTISDQYSDDSKIERLQKEREISSQLSTRCSAVRAPLGNACSKETITDTHNGILNNPRVICFEWTPGITLREWIQSQRNRLDLSATSSSLTIHNDNDIEERNRRSLMSFISLACSISKALAEIHEVGGVVLNNLSVEHIIVDEPQGS
eukprot:1804785-Ditylum_brightwellii.AAC.1